MKKLFIVALAAFGMVACMNEEITEMPNGGEISFDNAFIDNATRAELTAENLGEFKVWGYIADEEATSQTVTLFEGDEVSNETGAWKYEGGARYWAPGWMHYFEAVAPVAEGVVDVAATDGKINTIEYNMVDGESDIIYAAYNKEGNTDGSDNGAVSFGFDHLLSRIMFTFNNGFAAEDGISLTVKDVKMTVPAEGQYDVESGEWTVDTNTIATLTDIKGAKFVLPYGDSYAYNIEFKVDVTYKDVVINKDVQKKSTVMVALEKGNSYNFTATIDAESLNMESIEFVVGKVEGWTSTDTEMGVAYVSTVNALQAALNDPKIDDVVLTNSLEVAAGEDVTIDLNGKTISTNAENGYAIYNQEGGTLRITDSGKGAITGVVYTGENSTTIIDGGTFNAVDGGNYVLLNSGGSLTINGGTVNGGLSYPVYSYDANSKLVINDVTVNATFGCINAYTTGGEVEINGGTFTMTGVRGKTSHIAYFSNVDATINGGTFTKVGDISMSGTGGGGVCVTSGANLTINGGEFAGDHADIYDWGGTNANGRANSVSISGGIYKFKPTASWLADGFSVVAESDGKYRVYAGSGVVAVADGVATDGENYFISNAAGLAWVAEQTNTNKAEYNGFKGKTIKLIENINLSSIANWTPIGCGASHFYGTFDGNGKVISNMTITERYGTNNQAALFGTISLTVNIKNFTLDNAKVVYPNDAKDFYGAGIVGTYYGNLTLSDITVTNSYISGNNKVAGLLAHDGAASSLLIENCKVTKSTIESTDAADGGNVAGVLGVFQGYASGTHLIKNTSVTDCVIRGINSSDSGKRANSEFVGSVIMKSEATTLAIENCTVSGNTFTSGNTNYVSPYGDGRFVGGYREGDGYYKGIVIIDGAELKSAASQSEFNSAVANDAVIYLAEGTYKLPSTAATYTIVGTEDTIIDVTSGLSYAQGADVTFEGVTIQSKGGTGYERGFADMKNATFNNCVINGSIGLDDSFPVKFNNCVFNIEGDWYNVWTWGAPEVTFSGCTFNCDGKALLLYGGANTKCIVEGCTFNDNGDDTVTGKAAIEIGNDYNKSYELIVNKTTVNGFAINPVGINTGTTLWANKNSMGQDVLNVVVDGVDVY